MALYAYGEDDFVHAADAERGGRYWCLECEAPVKVRKGRYRFPHFYHLQTSPQCHLYSKSEDHLLLQLQLQKFLPTGEIEIEKPFLHINRVADLIWERKKMVFEIQCSSFDLGEAEQRTRDYRKIGYEIAWLLDDRIFNRRSIRESEAFVRSQGAYFIDFHRHTPSLFYDQFEIIFEFKRLKKGKPLAIDLRQPKRIPHFKWPKDLPQCIQERALNASCYFYKDLLHRAIQSPHYLGYALAISHWKTLEIQAIEAIRNPRWFKKFFQRFFATPYLQILQILLKRTLRTPRNYFGD